MWVGNYLGPPRASPPLYLQRSSPAGWLTGTIAGHRFEALVLPDHAADPGFELGDSRISKLWFAVAPRGDVVATFERGWDLTPTTPDAAAIVDLLAAGLAEHVFGR